MVNFDEWHGGRGKAIKTSEHSVGQKVLDFGRTSAIHLEIQTIPPVETTSGGWAETNGEYWRV